VLGGAQVLLDKFLLADLIGVALIGQKKCQAKRRASSFIDAKNCSKFFKVYFGLDRVEVVGFVYRLRVIFV